MKLDLYQVDAFTEKVFGGNPAAVCPLKTWLPDETMQKIAAENNLSETAFFVKDADAYYIRWFTPSDEVDLCGHATLAAAFVIFTELEHDLPGILFQSKSGPLNVLKTANGLMMDFPTWSFKDLDVSEDLSKALGTKPVSCVMAADIMAIYENAEDIINLNPDFKLLSEIPKCRGIIATAPAGDGDFKDYDFISRTFYPAIGVPEDPVTGSAHCVLTPYWSERLNKKTLRAYQASQRGGDLICTHNDERVEITGRAVLYLKGTIDV